MYTTLLKSTKAKEYQNKHLSAIYEDQADNFIFVDFLKEELLP